MKTLVLNAPEVSELLPIKECIAVMREALIALAAGKVHQPQAENHAGIHRQAW